MTSPISSKTLRYERLNVRGGLELDVSLQALAISPFIFGATPFLSEPDTFSSTKSVPAWLSLSPSPSDDPETIDAVSKEPATNPTPNTSADSGVSVPFRVVAALCKAALSTRNHVTPPPSSHLHNAPTPPTKNSQQPPMHHNLSAVNRGTSPTASHPVRKENYQAAPSSTTTKRDRIAPRDPTSSPSKGEDCAPTSGFRTARAALGNSRTNGHGRTRSLGSGIRRNPINGERTDGVPHAAKRVKFSAPSGRMVGGESNNANRENLDAGDEELPEVSNVEPRLVQMIMNEVLDRSPNVDWDDIAGLHFAKQCVMEAVVWPMLRPDIFNGLRGPPKGLLLFGPPGTGKTMIGRAIASRSGAKFFNISASSLVSKWAGEGEKTVRALFGVARVLQVRPYRFV